MVKRKRARNVMISAMAGSLALSSPFVFHVPTDAYTKEQIKELQQLSYGDHGESVVQLHRKLKTVDYYPGEVTDHYNALTEYAVKSFQVDQNIKANGELNQETMQLIDHMVHDKYISLIEKHGEQIAFGEQSSKVKQIQQALSFLGLYHDNVDGHVGQNTKKALKAFNQISDQSMDLSNLDAIATSQTTTNNQNSGTQNQSNQSSIQLTTASVSHDNVIATAKEYLGTPYRWGGQSPSGFDCSGFLQYVFSQHDISVPRTVNDIWNVTSPVSQPSVGDLVFFETYKPGPSHAGIYIGDGQFIHAGLSNGVTISNMSEQYWDSRYLGARSVNQ
ncbi:C40 family peptidase [Alkalibacillus aidingensis]|uniref:C40 family peptidase n=1 Tax=Alkalibacillus aidingensis TaxID=2747607 RepID=UPI0016607F6B|nr:NlpC/P60 family protein [Alkalibacillus aidingensis]